MCQATGQPGAWNFQPCEIRRNKNGYKVMQSDKEEE